MKRIHPILCAALALCLLLGACGQTPGKPSGHVHTWAADLDNHWTECDCDEPVTAEPHDLDEEGTCTDCGAIVIDWGDGTVTVEFYDDEGDTRSHVLYDSDGGVMAEWRWEKEYDEEGVLLRKLEYQDDFLAREHIYQPCENGRDGVFLAEQIYHHKDSSWYTETYDELGDLVCGNSYDADGNLNWQDTYEYERDDEGNVLYSAHYTDGVIVNDYWYFVGPDGKVYEEAMTIYDADGNPEIFSESMHEFDDEGRLIYRGKSTNGVMEWEMYFEVAEDGHSRIVREVTYDENGEIVSETIHDDFGE